MANEDLGSLVSDEETARALASVLARAEDGDGTVTYGTLSDVVEPETWGRLLECGVLVGAGDAFVVDDPPAVRSALEDADVAVTADPPDAPEPETGWRTSDKLAAVGAGALLTGYHVSAVESVVVGAVDPVLSPLAGVLPFPVLVLALATVTALVSTVTRRKLVDRERMDAQKERLRRVRERLEAAKERGDEAAVERLTDRQHELMREQFGLLKHSLRPLVWTTFVTVPVFLWLSWFVVDPTGAVVSTVPIVPVLDRVVWTARVVGPMQVWMLWYLASSIAANLAAKRTIDWIPVAPTPA